MLRKGVICISLVLFLITGFCIISATPCLAEEAVPIDITFVTAEDGTLYANDVLVPQELNLNQDDIVILMDNYLNLPENIGDLDTALHSLLTEIASTIGDPPPGE